MSNRSIEMFEYRQVIVQMRLGASDRAIAARKLVSRTKAHHIRRIAQEQGWLDPQQSLPNDDQLQMVLANTVRPLKSSTTSLVAPYQDQIEAWFHQGIQATTMHQALVRKYQFPGSYFSVQRAVKKLKALHAHQQASTILTFTPGEAAQIDFGAGPLITDVLSGEQIKTWIFAMTLCWSRHLYAEIVTHQTVETWLRCHRHAFEFFNQQGMLINWQEFSRLKNFQQIFTLAMISPFSVAEKQKLLECPNLNEVAEVLHEMIRFGFYESQNDKNSIQ